MNRKILETVCKYEMLPDGCTVVVGVSGGADSVALLHFINCFAKNNPISVVAAHVNHCLRGEESERDEQFVRDFCAQNRIELRVMRADVKAESLRTGQGLEECGRTVRYSFFNELAKDDHTKIATAHTLSDSTETVLLNLARGTGIHGLCGIPPVRGNIIRPFIAVSRAEVEQYCKENNLSYRIDSSNLSRDYTRNKLRLDIIPVLKEINPSFEEAVFRMTVQLRDEDAYLTNQAEQILQNAAVQEGYQVRMLADLPKPIQARAVVLAVQRICPVRMEAVHIELISEMLTRGEGAVTVPGGIQARIDRGIFYIDTEKEEVHLWKIPFCTSKILTDSGREFIIKIISKEEYFQQLKFNKLLFNNALDYDTISDSTFFRNRRDGDCFCRAGRGITKTVKKMFNEAKLPLRERDCVAMLESSGEILWIENFGVAQSAAVKDSTKSVVLISTRGV